MMMKRRLLSLVFVWIGFSAHSQQNAISYRYISKDSVIAFASRQYISHSVFRSFFMGNNYRKAWQQEVTLPVFRLSASGFTIKELGGGMQTKSLRLVDKSGKQWALRTVDKDVAGAMPSWAKNTFVQKLSQDLISAAMPFGAPVVGALAKAANINAAQPVVYFVADDKELAPYRDLFVNKLCLLEERDPGFDETENTETVLRNIMQSNQHVIAQKALLKARLLDVLVNDWDRHYDNWRWGKKDSAGIHYYYAIPRDRDWVFYNSAGLLPKISRLFALRYLVNFKAEPKHTKTLSAKTEEFDQLFLNGTTAADWKAAVQELQLALTDAVIEDAVNKFPPAIYAIYGSSFTKILKGRRDGLEAAALKYYRFLNRLVQVDGSHQQEAFVFAPAKEGFILSIYRVIKNGSAINRQKIYEREFKDAETYRVTINGLGGDDLFEMSETVKSNIKLKINGGEGRDGYDLKGDLRMNVFDAAAENNVILNKGKAKVSLQ